MAKEKIQKKAPGSVVARSEDGTIQITFNIPFSEIEKSRSEVVNKYADEIEIPGFRKGKAPQNLVKEKIPENVFLEKTLSLILPNLLKESLEKFKIAPAIYPKFELLKANENENWEIRATTCEIPKVDVGDYKKLIVDKLKSKTIWTTDKGKDEKSSTKQEKEEEVIKTLLSESKIKI